MSENNQKLTIEFCRNNILLFNPKTEEEAEIIQTQLFAMGFQWCYDMPARVAYTTECVKIGMSLKNHKICLSQDGESIKKGILCDINSFDIDLNNKVSYLTGDKLVREVFNQLSQQNTQISKQLESLKQENAELRQEMHELKHPAYKTIDKPTPQKNNLGW